MGSRTAISAGVLAVALAAVPGAAPAAAATGAATQDCDRGGGLLSGLTNTLCDVVKTVTGTVDTLTRDTTDPLTSQVDKTTDDVLGRVGEAVPTARPSAARTPKPSPAPTRTQHTPGIGEVCLPVLPCDGETVVDAMTPSPEASATPSPTRTAKPRLRERRASTAPLAPATPVQSRPQQLDTGRPVTDRPTADADDPRVDLLWPNPFAHELTVPMQDQRVVRPTPPASDVLGTTLTIALLGSAVLATRIVHQRRRRSEPVESIPFEPAHTPASRHRLA
ncbi:MAG TPA: hypothetical protein VFV66_07975 [Nonomuraea sp.]|nr:hypothetical protein [Nonomuraea sp.]